VKPSLEDTLELMRDLRRRCEWDAAQTHESLRPYLIEEAHEVDEALLAADDAKLREELGDLWLQILFHSVIAEERGAFGLHDIAESFMTKMKARHPHLYGEGERQPWERMKAKKRTSLEEGLPAGLPALHRAQRLQDRAAGVGFDWPTTEGPLQKVREELDEVEKELMGDEKEKLTAEIGDLLFAVVNPPSHSIEPIESSRTASRVSRNLPRSAGSQYQRPDFRFWILSGMKSNGPRNPLNTTDTTDVSTQFDGPTASIGTSSAGTARPRGCAAARRSRRQCARVRARSPRA
jgi:MazG family protein